MIKGRGKQAEDNTMLWACLGRAINYKDGSPLHHDTLAANAGLFFGAGYETSGHAVAWALFELAANPHLQLCLHTSHFQHMLNRPVTCSLVTR